MIENQQQYLIDALLTIGLGGVGIIVLGCLAVAVLAFIAKGFEH